MRFHRSLLSALPVGAYEIRAEHSRFRAEVRSGLILAKEKFAAAIDRAVFPGAQVGPLVHVVAAKAVCFLEAASPEFVAYSRQVLSNAHALASGLAEAGFRVVSGGTDTHVMLVDVFAKGVRGKEAETALDAARRHVE